MTHTVPVLTTNIHRRELDYGKTVFIVSLLFTVTKPTLQNVYHVNTHSMFRNNVTFVSSSSILKLNVCWLVWMEFKHSQNVQEFQLVSFSSVTDFPKIQFSFMTGTCYTSIFGETGTNSVKWNWLIELWICKTGKFVIIKISATQNLRKMKLYFFYN
jgi:hypothetical protein